MFNEPAQESLIYYLRQPATQESRPPLLVLLHGIGNNECTPLPLLASLDRHFLIASVRAPYFFEPGSYAWFDISMLPSGMAVNSLQLEASRKRVIALIRELMKAYHVNPRQVYLVGFSQGAMLAASIALTQPELIAGAVVASGALLPEVQASIAPAEQLVGLPMLLMHGTADAVVPIHYARATRDLLSTLPVELSYHEFAMAHEVSPECLVHLYQWLLDSYKKRLPDDK